MNAKPLKSGIDRIDPPGVVTSADPVTASNITLRQRLAIGLLTLFAGAVASTYALIFLWGFKKIELPPPFVHWLGGATIGQTASMLVLVVRDLFPAKGKGAARKQKTP